MQFTKPTLFVFGTLGLISTAFAQTKAAEKIVGMYTIGACDVDHLEGMKKARASLTGKTLELAGFNDEGSSRDNGLTIRLGRGTSPAQGTDGTESWATTVDSGAIVSIETFDRVGSDTWPDLVMRTETRLELDGDTLSITVDHDSNHAGRKTQSSKSCTLSSLADDANQVTVAKIKSMKNSTLESLAVTMPDRLNLDQGNLSLERAVLNKKSPTLAQVKEALNLEILSRFAPTLKVKAVGRDDDAKKTARAAFATAIQIANDYIKDGSETEEHYKPLFRYLMQVEAMLTKMPKGVKVYLVEWSESDADGEGLLFIDGATGEVLYIGSEYFS